MYTDNMNDIETTSTKSLHRNLILIGFMGAGKTSLGKAAARKLDMPFLDTDVLITEKEGMSVSSIFAQKGEPYFRALETQTLRELADRKDSYVLSVGGGLPLRKENHELLRKLGCVIYLQSSVDTFEKRLRTDTSRPVLQRGEGTLREKITSILAQREPVYLEAAHVVMVNDGKTFYEAADEVVRLYREYFKEE